MSDDPPPPAADAGSPLDSILSGFSEADDDVLAEPHRDGATTEPEPSRRPSAGRPLDDAPGEPLAAPVPDTPTKQTADHARRVPRRRRPNVPDVRKLVAAIPRAALKVALPLLAVVILIAAGSRGGPRAPATGGEQHRPATTRPDVTQPAARAARRGRARSVRRKTRRVRTARAVVAAAPVRRTAARRAAPPRVAPEPPPQPVAEAAPPSEFTSEFTP